MRAIKFRQRQADRELARKQHEMETLQREMVEKQAAFLDEQKELRRQQEELRIQHEAAIRQQKADMEQMQADAMRKQREEMQRMLEENLQRQKDEFAKMQQQQQRQPNNFAAPAAKPARKEAAFQIYTDAVADDSSSGLKSSVEDTRMLLQANPLGGSSSTCTGGSNPNSMHKTPPRLQPLSQPSPTVNTKEALSLVQEMWGNKPAPVRQDVAQSFAIFCDEKPTVAPNAPFPIFQDREDVAMPPPPPVLKKGLPKPILRPKEEEVAADDFKENVRPSETAAPQPPPTERRKSGILLEADNIPFVPLDQQQQQQQQQDDSTDEDEQQAPVTSSNKFNPNVTATMRVPSMEMFAEMARAASTPFSGRQFLPDVDENTCAVDIIFKKPAAPAVPPQQPKAEQQPEQEQQPPVNPLSPIMETSREHYRSSSTSSSNSSQSHLTKSHWGNTHMHVTSGASISNARTPGTFLMSKSSMKPAELTASSGYMADSSRTPGTFLAGSSSTAPPSSKPLARELPASPSVTAVQAKAKKAKLNYDEEDDEVEDDEPTGLFSGMLGEFGKGAGLTVAGKTSSSSSNFLKPKPQSSFLQQSLKASFLEPSEMSLGPALTVAGQASSPSSFLKPKPQSSFLQQSLKASFLEPSEMSLGLAKDESLRFERSRLAKCMANSTQPAAAAELSLVDPPAMELSQAPPLELSCMAPPPPPELSYVAEEERVLEAAVNNLSLADANLNPFSLAVHAKLLHRIPQPVEQRHGYYRVRGQSVPHVRPNTSVQLGNKEFIVMECKGEGGYGKVYKALKKDDANPNETIADLDVVLKIQVLCLIAPSGAIPGMIRFTFSETCARMGVLHLHGAARPPRHVALVHVDSALLHVRRRHRLCLRVPDAHTARRVQPHPADQEEPRGTRRPVLHHRDVAHSGQVARCQHCARRYQARQLSAATHVKAIENNGFFAAASDLLFLS